MIKRMKDNGCAPIARHPLSSVLFLLSAIAVVNAASAQVGLQANTGKDCAVCHLEWVTSFQQPRAINLMPEPEKPVVAASETCLGCHDGSVDDSRRMVWHDHGHRTGVAPSAGMNVPANLPLEDGKIACRTCHNAHAAGGGAGESLKDVFFLRMPNTEGQLCRACHTGQSGGPEKGSHPLGPMKEKLPEKLAAAGAHGGADAQQVVCQSCHAAHGARQDHLLLMGTSNSELCITCHQQMRPAMFMANGEHEHPQNPPLRPQHIEAIQAMKTRIGEDNTLVCLSCHKVHNGNSGRAMLADTLENSRLCIRCHAERSNMVGSAHDLRKSAPNELNRLGLNPVQSGPCGSCHTFHSYARDIKPGRGDPQGLCVTCHDQGKVAAKHSGQPFSHPFEIESSHIPRGIQLALYNSPTDPNKKAVACLSCHNPHEMAQPHFLRTTGDALCANCHGEKVANMGGPHDFSRKQFVNAKGRSSRETGKCGFCHAVHDAKGPAMWVATQDAPKTTDDFCVSCHNPGGIGHDKPLARFNHPTGTKARATMRPVATVPLYGQDLRPAQDGSVACSSCHDLHLSGKQSKHLLRPSGNDVSLCIQCHTDKNAMAGGLHDFRINARDPGVPVAVGPGKQAEPGHLPPRLSTDLCMNCHRPHSNDEQKKRWTVAPVAGATREDALCVSCHPNANWTTSEEKFPLGAMLHPQAIAADSPVRKTNHNLPVRSGESDLLHCGTCHNPHAGEREQHLLRIEPNAPPSDVCVTCHDEARTVMKAMHSPEVLDPNKPDRHACRPCHASHAIEGSERKMLWAARKYPQGRTNAEQWCLGCHGPTGTAKKPTLVTHPETAMRRIADTLEPALKAKMQAMGNVTCDTCHLPHGRDLLPAETAAATQPVARALRSAIKPMLKPDVDREICATCHGIDSTRVYLYFHNPKKREMIKKLIGG